MQYGKIIALAVGTFMCAGAASAAASSQAITSARSVSVTQSFIETLDGPEHHRRAFVGGRVVDDAGEPVADAYVRLLKPNGEVIRMAQTAENGFYFFRPVKPGPYLVRAFHDTSGHGQKPVFARPGRLNRVKIELTQ